MAAQKRNKGKLIQMLSPENYIKQKARSLPIAECWINKGWEEDGLANIMVARKHSNNHLTVGMYLVDLKCLGVKDVQYFFNMSPAEYRDLQFQYHEHLDVESVNYVVAHNIVYAGIEFAEDYGFKPHKDFGIAEYILEEDNDDIELIEIPCGKDNKPFYLRGPLESDQRAKQIIAQLEKTAGAGNYTFIDGLDLPWNDDIMPEDLVDLSLDEKLEIIVEFIDKADKLSIEEANEMRDLIESVFLDFIDLDKVDECYDNFMNELDGIEVLEKSPDEMFQVCGLPPELIPDFKTDFEDVEEMISEGKRAASKKLEALTKRYPANAALQYLELFLLQTKESQKLDSVLQKSIKLYPDSPLIYLYWNIHTLKKESDNVNLIENPEIDINNAVGKVFPGRKKLYTTEMFYLILYLVLQPSLTLNMEQIEALDDLIYEVNLNEADIELLEGFIKMGKMTFVVGLIESRYSEE